MSTTKTTRIALTLVAFLALACSALAQIKTKRGAVVLYGSTANCSEPSTVNHKKVQKATPEWQTIKSDGVRKGSARYDLLISEMNARIKRACSAAARANSRDCIVRKGDIKDDEGLNVTDLTTEVIDELGK